MDTVFKGHLILEKNPEFSAAVTSGATVGNNEIEHIVLTVHDDDVDKIKKIISSYNPPNSPIENRYSFPVNFEVVPGAGLAAHIKFKIRSKRSNALLKLIDWNHPALIRLPLNKWVGLEFTINARLNKYCFDVAANTGMSENNVEVIDGGAKQKLRGVTFYITSIMSLIS